MPNNKYLKIGFSWKNLRFKDINAEKLKQLPGPGNYNIEQ